MPLQLRFCAIFEIWVCSERYEKQGGNGFNITHWGRVMHVCASKLATIGSDNGLSPGQRQAIIDLRTAQVYCDPIFLVSQEVYLNFHHFCV